MTNVSIPEVYMLKNSSSTLAVSVPINLSIKLGFVSVNGHRETYLWLHYVRGIQPVACLRPSGEFCVAQEGYFTKYNALRVLKLE